MRLPETPETDDSLTPRPESIRDSLHAAVEALAVCVDTMYELIEQVDAIAPVASTAETIPRAPSTPDVAGAPPRRARVTYGGGLSPLADPDPGPDTRGERSIAGPAAAARLSVHRETAVAGAPEPYTVPPGTASLMAATELAHRGYGWEEIAARLRERWGDGAERILRELTE